MWTHCLDCTRKHLATAWTFLNETHLGYAPHRWLAAGELVHAENEVMNFERVKGDRLGLKFAEEIRATRLTVMKSHDESFDADIFRLITIATVLAGEEEDLAQGNGSSKFYDAVVEAQSWVGQARSINNEEADAELMAHIAYLDSRPPDSK